MVMASDMNCLTLTHKYQISIRPYKCPQDHEKLDINVKSLVHLFEADDSNSESSLEADELQLKSSPLGAQEYRNAKVEGKARKVPLSGCSSSELPDIVVCSEEKSNDIADIDYEDDFYKPVPILPPRASASVKDSKKHTRQVRFVPESQRAQNELDSDTTDYSNASLGRNGSCCGSVDSSDLEYCIDTGDSSILEALKDILDKTSHYKQSHFHAKDRKVRRVKLKEKSTASGRPFPENVHEIFKPNVKERCNQYLHKVVDKKGEGSGKNKRPGHGYCNTSHVHKVSDYTLDGGRIITPATTVTLDNPPGQSSSDALSWDEEEANKAGICQHSGQYQKKEVGLTKYMPVIFNERIIFKNKIHYPVKVNFNNTIILHEKFLHKIFLYGFPYSD